MMKILNHGLTIAALAMACVLAIYLHYKLDRYLHQMHESESASHPWIVVEDLTIDTPINRMRKELAELRKRLTLLETEFRQYEQAFPTSDIGSAAHRDASILSDNAGSADN